MDPNICKVVSISWEGEIFLLRIPTSANIHSVKFSIMEELGIPIAVDRQMLLLGGRPLSDEKFAMEYDIEDGSVLTLHRCIKATIQAPGGQVFSKIVNEDDTVGGLKGLLVYDGVVIEGMILQMGVDTKLDDRCHLWAAGITENSVLSLVPDC